MGRLVTYEQYLNMLAERTIDNTRQLRKSVHQRRNGMEDLYGICFSANGDGTYPAKFYISLSPDYVYLQRFAFKFVLKPYMSSVTGVSGGGSLTIDPTSLTGGAAESYVISGTSTLDEDVDGAISPNPHTHTASGDVGTLNYGVKEITSTSTSWGVSINNVDITPYLLEQQGKAIGTPLFDHGNGVYPSLGTTDLEDFYDILDVVSVMIAEGNPDADEILKPGFKPVEISSTQPFGIDAYLYMKYSNLNR